MKVPSIVFAFVVGVSCAGAADQPALSEPVSLQAKKDRTTRTGQNFDLRIGESVYVEGEGLTVTFSRVLEDSRCPTNTTCIWAGDAVVRLALVAANAERATLDLHTGSESAAEGRFQRFRLRLVRLGPVPRDGASIPAGEYVATLIVTLL